MTQSSATALHPEWQPTAMYSICNSLAGKMQIFVHRPGRKRPATDRFYNWLATEADNSATGLRLMNA